MGFSGVVLPEGGSFVLQRARVPRPFLADSAHSAWEADRDGAVLADIRVERGIVAEVTHASSEAVAGAVDLENRHVWPTLVDVHAHLDKGHIVDRAPNHSGTFEEARSAATADRDTHWTQDDIVRRMEFGLRCAEAHGVFGIRTHLDTYAGHWPRTWDAFEAVRTKWASRITLQAVALQPIAMYREAYMTEVADRAADVGALLGGAIRATGDDLTGQLADIDAALDILFAQAKERGLDIDLHVDECGEPTGAALPRIAQATMRYGYEGRVTCGHCCSLALQDESTMRETIALVADAGLSIVTLPTVNMYLQDRIAGRTPQWRGVTPAKELMSAGVRVAVAGDNCRDPFHAYGDHDMLDTFRQAVRIAHLDHPLGNTVALAGPAPAGIMSLKELGSIRIGAPANFILMNARTFDQIMARPQADRIILRRGKAIEAPLPSYDELQPAS